MTAEERLHTWMLLVTVAAMLVLVTEVKPLLEGNPKWADFVQQHPRWRFLPAVVGVFTSMGLYKSLVAALRWLTTRSNLLLARIMGPQFLKGTWVGLLSTKLGHERLIIEHYEQTISSLVIRGRSYTLDGKLDATWHTRTTQIDVRSGSLYCFYVTNVLRKHYPVEGIGCFDFDRKGPGAPPRRLSGYAIDSDAGVELSAENAKKLKIVYEHLKKIDSKLLTWDEARTKAVAFYKEQAALRLAARGDGGNLSACQTGS